MDVLKAQISPGDLSNAHAEFEGISNCTKCHDLGKSVSKAKCLNCHTEIIDLINENRGYHLQKEVIQKDCWVCHGEHFGRNFQIVKFDEKNFDHDKSGFELKGSHKKLECNKCHKAEFITIEKFKKKEKTFIGLTPQCKTCHEDVHQGTLDDNCATCHNEEKFKPAINFKHDNTQFKLTGTHLKVDCEKCHVKENRNNKTFQKFADVKFNSCNSCHKDFHQGKFGNECETCHNTNSFNEVNVLNGFDHSKTNFPLLGKHNRVKCENCHKESLTSKPKFAKCYDCHEDFHKGEFIKNNIQTDCKECHNEKGFSPSQFTIEMHNKTSFELINSHAAIPCISCHLKEESWKFRISGEKCISCHSNIHESEIGADFFYENNCQFCHSTLSWKNVKFDHTTTEFELIGKHKSTECRDCHFTFDGSKIIAQKFKQLNSNCTQCHNDIHNGQFIEDGKELCKNCHTSFNWQPSLFDHSKTRFALAGAHLNVKCEQCHKHIVENDITFIKYKIEDVRCISCHS
ncbi:MAG: cytochrome C [Ignavibacteriae bacterium]|nr:cytochrome C [Ignavibacteriota bacterium]